MARYEGYIGTTVQAQVVEPELDGVAITTADTATWEVTTRRGTSVSNGNLSYTATLPITNKAGWYANFNRPGTAGDYHLHMTITKNGATMKWHDELRVKAFS